MRLIKWMMLPFVIVLLSGCAVKGSYCAIAKPIYWDRVEDIGITPESITRQVVRHNEVYSKVCREK